MNKFPDNGYLASGRKTDVSNSKNNDGVQNYQKWFKLNEKLLGNKKLLSITSSIYKLLKSEFDILA